MTAIGAILAILCYLYLDKHAGEPFIAWKHVPIIILYKFGQLLVLLGIAAWLWERMP